MCVEVVAQPGWLLVGVVAMQALTQGRNDRPAVVEQGSRFELEGQEMQARGPVEFERGSGPLQEIGHGGHAIEPLPFGERRYRWALLIKGLPIFAAEVNCVG